MCVCSYLLDQKEAFSHDRIIDFNFLQQSSKDFDILAKLLHLQGLTVQWSWSTLLTSSSATSSSCRRLVTVCAHNRHFVTDLPSQASLIPLGTGNLLKTLLLGPWSYSWTLLLITIFLWKFSALWSFCQRPNIGIVSEGQVLPSFDWTSFKYQHIKSLLLVWLIVT